MPTDGTDNISWSLPLATAPPARIVAVFAAMAGAITVLLGEAVTLAVPRRRPGTGGPARTYLPPARRAGLPVHAVRTVIN